MSVLNKPVTEISLLTVCRSLCDLLEQTDADKGEPNLAEAQKAALQDAVLTYITFSQMKQKNFQFFVVRPGSERLEPVDHYLDRIVGEIRSDHEVEANEYAMPEASPLMARFRSKRSSLRAQAARARLKA